MYSLVKMRGGKGDKVLPPLSSITPHTYSPTFYAY